ncbi:hypothetical protein BDZ89DRAFT_1050021 [Hymenopellis radicata]|nr:hypothetical protein BDZ89DRAFT_1050021 [Hymenopellis radicata]
MSITQAKQEFLPGLDRVDNGCTTRRLTGPGEPDSWLYFSFYHHDQLTTYHVGLLHTILELVSIELDNAATIDPASLWLVQKFGGTSVGKFALQIARDIVSHYNHCALGSAGFTKALGTTNLLLRAADEALSSSKKRESVSGTATPILAYWVVTGFYQTVELIRYEQNHASKEDIRDPDVRKELEDEIDADCEWLASFLSASQNGMIGYRRELATVSRLYHWSRERLACKFMTAHDIDAEYVSFEDIVPLMDDDSHTARYVSSYASLPSIIDHHLDLAMRRSISSMFSNAPPTPCACSHSSLENRRLSGGFGFQIRVPNTLGNRVRDVTGSSLSSIPTTISTIL